MPSFKHLVTKLQTDFPSVDFVAGERYTFHPPNQVIFDARHPDQLSLLHELGHFLIKAHDYQYDVELLRIESAAWAKAAELANDYHVAWNEDNIQDHLDSYRDWLHQVSLCPNCQLSGYQDTTGCYHCPLCEHEWQRNLLPE